MRQIALSAKGNVIGDVDVFAGDDAFAARAGGCDRERRNNFFKHLHKYKRRLVQNLQSRREKGSDYRASAQRWIQGELRDFGEQRRWYFRSEIVTLKTDGVRWTWMEIGTLASSRSPLIPFAITWLLPHNASRE